MNSLAEDRAAGIKPDFWICEPISIIQFKSQSVFYQLFILFKQGSSK